MATEDIAAFTPKAILRETSSAKTPQRRDEFSPATS